MIDYKKPTTSNDSIVVERVPTSSSANLDGPVSLTWLWEVITRTKRIPGMIKHFLEHNFCESISEITFIIRYNNNIIVYLKITIIVII